jgi:hypothetical protein
MSPLLTILRAVHCRSTHHYFALDALRMVQTDAGLRLRGILLKHHEKYLMGSKDPDDRFRDFQNHVIHVQDGYFGGAPRVAIQWYDRMMGHLVAGRWEDSAYAMGVLTHYFTDPLMPLHTAQSPRESLVHRPMEWSVCKSYDRILKLWTEDELRLVFHLGDGEGWLGEAILKGARFANRNYKKLVDSYNVDLGVENPAAALDQESLRIFAELFGLAITGLARVFERAADQAENRLGAKLPSYSLTMPALLAALQVPEQMWLKRITNCTERAAIEAIVGEFRQTGQVKENIPAEVYIKQRVTEVREREAAWNQRRRELALARGAHAATILATVAEPVAIAGVIEPAKPSTLESIAAAPTTTPFALTEDVPATKTELTTSPDQAATGDAPPISIPFTAAVREPKPQQSQARLQRHEELSNAPSIGPKTAASFAQISILTVGDFLDAPAAALSRRLGKSWITANVIQSWQAQTRLMCDVPGLLSRDVQMLVGVGCNSAAALANATATSLVQSMQRYALSSEGKRALRSAEPAELALVEQWISNAQTFASNRAVA